MAGAFQSIPNDDCINLLDMLSTAYWHVQWHSSKCTLPVVPLTITRAVRRQACTWKPSQAYLWTRAFSGSGSSLMTPVEFAPLLLFWSEPSKPKEAVTQWHKQDYAMLILHTSGMSFAWFSMAKVENEVDNADDEWFVVSSSSATACCICLTGCCGCLPFINVLSMNTNSCSVLDVSESTDELSLIIHNWREEKREKNGYLKA